MKISFTQRWFQPSKVSFHINLNSRGPCHIFETSAVIVFVLLFSFSIFSERQSLNTENEKKKKKKKHANMDAKIRPQNSHTYIWDPRDPRTRSSQAG